MLLELNITTELILNWILYIIQDKSDFWLDSKKDVAGCCFLLQGYSINKDMVTVIKGIVKVTRNFAIRHEINW